IGFRRLGRRKASHPHRISGPQFAGERIRSGFSLMEVILATAILLGSVVVLGELAGMGRRQSLRGRELSEAQLLCEQVLQELLLGLREFEQVEQEPLRPAAPLASALLEEESFTEAAESLEPFAFTDDPAASSLDDAGTALETVKWLYSLRLAPLEAHPGLAVLTVTVEQSPELTTRPIRFELSRWIEDPLAAELEDRSDGSVSGALAVQEGGVP
ncbi:MAG: hypothetical protein KF861_23940, partial [Planctomycetaceae bacterium]|nr:hypothetical protein [Planctomycetaceae bacterium]